MRNIRQDILDVEGVTISLRFQAATNGIVCIADAGEFPVILTGAVNYD